MNCLIVYSALNPDHSRATYQAVETTFGRIFIRTEPSLALDLVEALEDATPLEGEVVLNTISAPTQ